MVFWALGFRTFWDFGFGALGLSGLGFRGPPCGTTEVGGVS